MKTAADSVAAVTENNGGTTTTTMYIAVQNVYTDTQTLVKVKPLAAVYHASTSCLVGYILAAKTHRYPGW